MWTKFKDWTTSPGNSTKYTKNLHLSSSNYSKKLKRKEHSQIHSIKPPATWYQTQRHHTKKERKKKLQVNIFDDYGYRNPHKMLAS